MIEVAALKTALRVTSSTETGYIRDLEKAAVAHIERETGRYYGPVRTATEVVVGNGYGSLYLAGPVALDVYGVAQVASVNEFAYPGGTATEVVGDEGDGYVVRANVMHRKNGGWWLRGYEYTVVYEQGYEPGEEPADIRQAVMQLVTHWFDNRMPVVTGTIAIEVPLSVQAIIDANRRMRV